MVRYWDKAATEEGTGSKTAGVLMAFMSKDCFYGVLVLDCVTGRMGAGDRENRIKQIAQLDGIEVEVGVEQEPGSGGKESAQNTVLNTLIGFKTFVDRPTGAKEVRLDPFIAQVDHRNVAVLSRRWTREYIDSLEECAPGHVTDEGDATSGAFNKLAGLSGKSRARIRVA